MKILILTQNDNLILPHSINKVCEQLRDEIVAIVASPPLSTHGGFIQGIRKHLSLFGMVDFSRLAFKVLTGRIKAAFFSRFPGSPFSLRGVAHLNDLPYYYIPDLRSSKLQEVIDQYKPELLISMSCPQIIRKPIRDQFAKGCINVHSAPLPKYRGLMPCFWVLCNNESKTAVTVHELARKLDDGDLFLQKEMDISSADSWFDLVRKTKMLGADVLIQAVKQISDGSAIRNPNSEAESTYFSFPTADDRKTFLKQGKRFF